MHIENRNEDRRRAASRAALGAVLGVLVSLGAFGGCAKGTEETVGPTSGPATTGQGGGGGAGEGGAGEGGAGGGPMCQGGTTEECYSGPDGTKGVGLCVAGTRTCLPGGTQWSACVGEVLPKEETCETAEDDDCDGAANEEGASCMCVPGETQPCYTGPQGTQGVGVCAGGTSTCNELGVGWGPCEGEVVPSPEDCSNALDEDCDAAACAAPLWNVLFGGPLADVPKSMAIDAQGSVFVGGTFSGTIAVGGEMLTSAGGTDGFLAKFDALGAFQWIQAFGDAADQGVTAVGVDPSGNIFVGGYFSGTLALGGVGGVTYTANGKDGFLAKLGTTGAHLWSKRLGLAGTQGVTSLVVGAAGDAVVGGTFDGTLFCPFGCIQSQGGQDVFLFKYNDQGTLLWFRSFGDPAEQVLNALALDAAGSLVLTGHFQGNAVDFGDGAPLGSAGGYDVFLVKLDPDGVNLFSKRYGDPLDQRGTALTTDAAGNIFLTGSFTGSVNFGALDLQSAGFADVFVVKLGPDGAYQWANTYGDATDQVPGAIGVDAAGNAVVTGGFQGMVDFGGGPLTSVVSYDVFLVKLNDQGKHVWSKRFGNSASQIGVSLLIEPASSNILLTGAASGVVDFGLGPLMSAGGDDVFIAKISP